MEAILKQIQKGLDTLTVIQKLESQISKLPKSNYRQSLIEELNKLRDRSLVVHEDNPPCSIHASVTLPCAETPFTKEPVASINTLIEDLRCFSDLWEKEPTNIWKEIDKLNLPISDSDWRIFAKVANTIASLK